MSGYQRPDSQLAWMMFMLADLAPGCVCMDSACPTGDLVPHMANDGRNHPHPYGVKPPWNVRMVRKIRLDRKRLVSKL